MASGRFGHKSPHAPDRSNLQGVLKYEQSYYNVLARQKTFPTVDVQLSPFSRDSSLHFIPDQVRGLEFNGVSSNVFASCRGARSAAS
jgi:hypothetical protein